MGAAFGPALLVTVLHRRPAGSWVLAAMLAGFVGTVPAVLVVVGVEKMPLASALIGALLLLAALLLRSGFAAGLAPTRAARLATGLASGFVNGVAAIGGIAVAVLLSATALTPAAMRATMIALLSGGMPAG